MLQSAHPSLSNKCHVVEVEQINSEANEDVELIIPDDEKAGKTAKHPKWGRLRSLLPKVAEQSKAKTSVVNPGLVNITDELIGGGLSSLMLGFHL